MRETLFLHLAQLILPGLKVVTERSYHFGQAQLLRHVGTGLGEAEPVELPFLHDRISLAKQGCCAKQHPCKHTEGKLHYLPTDVGKRPALFTSVSTILSMSVVSVEMAVAILKKMSVWSM